MQTADLKQYCEKALEWGVTDVKVIHPSTVITAPWVLFKCMYGCSSKHNYTCPPHTPSSEQTRATLDSYNRAILFRLEGPYEKERDKKRAAFLDMLVKLEGQLFKGGYYKSFVMLAGPCTLCKECGIIKGVPCRFPEKTRPSMEACGIDVYQTARNNGFFIESLSDEKQTRNSYCLMLVD